MTTISYEATYPLNPRETRSGSLTVNGPVSSVAAAVAEVFRGNYSSISGFPTAVTAVGIDVGLGGALTPVGAATNARQREAAANDMLNAAARREGIQLSSAQLAQGRRALYETGSRQRGEMAMVGAANASQVKDRIAGLRGASTPTAAGTGNS